MYHMHWTLDDINKLHPDQMNWLVESLKLQKKREARAAKGKRGKRPKRR